MGFLSKRSMLVSLLALSLAACTSKPMVTGPLTIDLPCDGDVMDHTIDKKTQPTVIFNTSGCDLTDVNFTNDVGKAHFKTKKRSAATSIKFDYDASDLGGGAKYYYSTPFIPTGSSKDGGGNGIIKSK